MFALLTLFACAPAPTAYAPDLSAYSGTEAACLQKHCGGAASEDAFGACRVEKCAGTPGGWAVEPTLLRYENGVVTMSVDVDHTPAAHGDVTAAPDADTFLGATVIKSSGEEVDMAVHTVFPDRLGEPFTFSSEVGDGVELVIVGLWGEKVEPCDSTRSGCQMFGFVLDESLAAWPAGTYAANPLRQRFLPAEMKLSLATPPKLPTADRERVVKALLDFTKAEGQRFGTKFATSASTWPVVQGSSADAPPAAPTASEVRYKHAHDGPFAKRLAAALATFSTGEIAVRHAPDETADLAVLLGPDACPAGIECR